MINEKRQKRRAKLPVPFLSCNRRPYRLSGGLGHLVFTRHVAEGDADAVPRIYLRDGKGQVHQSSPLSMKRSALKASTGGATA